MTAWADAVRRGVIEPRPRGRPTALVLMAGSGYNRHHLKNRLLIEGLKDARCEDCGLTEWRGRPLALELHHINGDGSDNRLENLSLLCPNCHSQTDTWGVSVTEVAGPAPMRPPSPARRTIADAA